MRGLPRQSGDVFLVSPHGAAHRRARVWVPQPDILVHPAAGDDATVGRPRDAQHPVGVSFARVLGRLRLVVPQSHGGVAAPAGQVLAVRGEGDGEDSLGVAGDGGGASRDWTHAEQRLGLIHDAKYLLHRCVAFAQVIPQLSNDLRVGGVKGEGHLILVLQQGVQQLLQLFGVRVVREVQLRPRGVALRVLELRYDVHALGPRRRRRRRLGQLHLSPLGLLRGRHVSVAAVRCGVACA